MPPPGGFMKVDVIEDCKFNPTGISVQHHKAGETGIEVEDDMALSLIGYGFCKESKAKSIEEVIEKALVEAPENKMIKDAPENKKAESAGKQSGKKSKAKKKK